MTPTIIGLAVLLAAMALLVLGTRLQMLVFVLACALMHGSAAVVLTGLGNTSIQPALVAVPFLLMRCLLPSRAPSRLGAALSANAWLILLAGYSAIGAFVLPFVFRGAIDVVPLRPNTGPTGLVTAPLQFTAQNITTAFYMLATATGAIAAHMAANRPGAGPAVARTASVVTLAHVAIGWLAVATANTGLDAVIRFFRNGRYMQLDQSFEGFSRLTGIAPEPSLYASFGYAWFVFAAELWLRNVDRRWSGSAALAMFLTLVASTSSTAYVGLAGYSLLVLLRLTFFTGTIPVRKWVAMAACGVVLAVCALAVMVGSDSVYQSVARIMQLTTTAKLKSESGLARSFWAMQGLQAFVQSWGLGIGAGSFRSSSIVTAVLGSSGVIGIAALALYLLRVFRPFAAATFSAVGDADRDTAAAGAWAVLMILVPASVSAPSPDPGLLWGLIAGTVLGLRSAAARAASGTSARLREDFLRPTPNPGGGRIAVTSMNHGTKPFVYKRTGWGHVQIAVIIATTGRSELLRQTVARLARQTRKADRVIVCAVSESDVAGLAEAAPFPLEIILADRGLPKQRNAGLRHLAGGADIVTFFDDDFVAANDYLEVLERQFATRPNVVGATAVLLADGIKSCGIGFDDAVAIIEQHRPSGIINERRLPALYGCNLCIRLSAAEGIWFDETLPLYGWQEDVDFSYQLGAKGLLIYTNQLTGVHLGTKGGRTSGKRLGYSQIANPIYLLRKKTIPPRLAWRLMVRNLLANVARSVWPEPYVDRFGRLNGNVEALVDLALGRVHPERILKL